MSTTIVRLHPPVDRFGRRVDAAAANAERLHFCGLDAAARTTPDAGHSDPVEIDAASVPEPTTPQTVKAALAKVLASSAFRHSERHRTFLCYIVDAVIAGRERQLKEVVVGLDVFDRNLDRYDTRRDSIVRVEARRLRQKLLRYYEDEGADDALEIRLDAGSYVPAFVPRTRTRHARGHGPLVVVMPLMVAGNGELAAVVAIGLADQMIDRVGSLHGLHVMAPRSADGERLGDMSPGDLRRKHCVDFVIDGSVTQIGTKLRCVARVSSTTDRMCRWSRVFDFVVSDDASDDVFAFQDRITAALCEALNMQATIDRETLEAD